MSNHVSQLDCIWIEVESTVGIELTIWLPSRVGVRHFSLMRVSAPQPNTILLRHATSGLITTRRYRLLHASSRDVYSSSDGWIIDWIAWLARWLIYRGALCVTTCQGTKTSLSRPMAQLPTSSIWWYTASACFLLSMCNSGQSKFRLWVLQNKVHTSGTGQYHVTFDRHSNSIVLTSSCVSSVLCVLARPFCSPISHGLLSLLADASLPPATSLHCRRLHVRTRSLGIAEHQMMEVIGLLVPDETAWSKIL